MPSKKHAHKYVRITYIKWLLDEPEPLRRLVYIGITMHPPSVGKRFTLVVGDSGMVRIIAFSATKNMRVVDNKVYFQTEDSEYSYEEISSHSLVG